MVYTKSGTYLTAAVIEAGSLEVWGLPTRGLVVENVLYRFDAGSVEEAHYLAALLNAPCVDTAIKPFQGFR